MAQEGAIIPVHNHRGGRSDTVVRGYRDDEFGRRGGKAARHRAADAKVNFATIRAVLSRRKRSPNLARGLDEFLRGGAERAIPQCHDSVWQARDGEFDGQDLNFGSPTEELQHGSRQDREEAPGGQETDPHFRWHCDHSRTRALESVGAEGLVEERCNRCFRWSQHPGFIHEFGKRNPSPPCPRTLHARSDDQRILIERFKLQSLIVDGSPQYCDQEINVPLIQSSIERTSPLSSAGIVGNMRSSKELDHDAAHPGRSLA